MKLRKGDIIIGIILIIAVGLWVYTNNISNSTATDNLVIEVNGDLYKKMPVRELKKEQLIHIELENNKYIDIAANENGTRVEDVVCPDKLCQKTGTINKVGQNIVCLPNKVVIYYEGNEEPEVDNVAY